MAFPVERRCVHHMLEQRVKEDPDARLLTIIGDSAESYTRAEVWDLSKRVAGAYRSVGVVPGDRVVLMLENRIEFTSAWLGAMAVGAIAAPLNTMFAGPILANMLETMAPAVIVIEAGLVQGVTEALNDAAYSGIVAIVGATEPVDLAGHKTADFNDWLSVAPIEDVHQAIPPDTASLMYTSGTTGPSKGCMWPHNLFITAAEVWADIVGYQTGDVIHSATPMFHGLALMSCFTCSILIGGEAVIPVRFSVTNYWKQIHDYKATRGVLVGQMMTLLANQDVDEYEVDNTLESVFCGPIPADFERIESRFGLRMSQGYGQADVGIMIAQPPTDTPFDKTSMGKVLDDWELQLVDDNDNPVPVGEPGELIARPRKPFISSKGYFGMPEATAELLRNAWYHTGDVLRCDYEGWYYLVDRKKDAIRRGGENISSFEVEQVLLSHPSVQQAAVIAVPSDLSEDDVMACLVVDDVAELVAIGDYAEANLPYFAVPRYYDALEELPVTPNNKIRKVELRERGITSTAWDRGRTRRQR
jgi:crotonobetaine/carnitine-CoA ligase